MGGVKSGRFYLLSRGPMGRFCAACEDSQALGILDTGFGIFDAPAYAFGMVYIGGVGARLKAWQISMDACGVRRGAQREHLWLSGRQPRDLQRRRHSSNRLALDVSGFGKSLPAVLHAYWANNLAEIYNSAQASGSATLRGRRSSSPCRRWPMARSTSAPRPTSTFTDYCRLLPSRPRRARHPSLGSPCAAPVGA